MPFTTSHPAIVLPLKKWWPEYVSLSGLMAGAMAPDLLYFLNMTTVHRGFSHSWPGLFAFCIPAGTIFVIVFHYLIKRPLLLNLPSPLDRIFSGLAQTRLNLNSNRSILVLLVSVTIGALSHFFWDSFTHHKGVIARSLPFLTDQITLFGSKIYISFIFQHISTLVGFIFMVYFFWGGNNLPEPVADFKPRKGKLLFWIIGGILSLMFALFVCWFFEHYVPHYMVSLYQTIGLAGWAGFFYYLIIRALLNRENRQN